MGEQYNHSSDGGLIALSYIVATLGTYPTVILISSADQFFKVIRPIWVVTLAALSMSSVGLWATHFVGLSALHIGADVKYSYTWFIISLTVGFFCLEGGFYCLLRDKIHRQTTEPLWIVRPQRVLEPSSTILSKWFHKPNFRDIALSSIFVSAGVSATHFLGIKSMLFDGYITWNIRYVVMSCCISYCASLVSLIVVTSFKYTEDHPLVLSQAIAIAVCLTHYTAVHSAQFMRGVVDDAPGIAHGRIENVITIAALVSTNIVAACLGRIMWSSNRFTAEQMEVEREHFYHMVSEYIPPHILGQLISGQSNVVRRSDSATVMFCRVLDFTAACEENESKIVPATIALFGVMDSRLSEYGITKIKTIGDIYMCSSGCPTEQPTHTTNMIRYSAQTLGIALHLSREMDMLLQLRIGISTGDIVNGVVGYRKASFDIWGSVVNQASRMESTGATGAIQISESAKLQLEREGNSLDANWSDRTVYAKGFGSVSSFVWMPEESYLLETVKCEFTLDAFNLHWLNKLQSTASRSPSVGHRSSHPQTPLFTQIGFSAV